MESEPHLDREAVGPEHVAAANEMSLFPEIEWSDLPAAARQAYDEARMSGVCHEGALEVALRHTQAALLDTNGSP